MAKVSLREYNREIENKIERGQIDEAIAHCKHILKYYPKHIDTYRLLGKAFLENQRYTEAADILQRVLSVLPDDFISQIGMSIVREDERNLDAAIFHMERAYEVQPANSAVQEELRRLYGARDGVEPPRLRLTRGALVRMYARNELYPQAIAEIRAALGEDPQRIDLDVILARLYYVSGQKVAATEVSSRLISKLPHCYEANRILTEILPGTARAEDAKTYKQRLYALDPYTAFVSSNAPAPEQVPDNAVTLDYLEHIEPEREAAGGQPSWAQSIGLAWEEENKAEETLPAWLPAPTVKTQETVQARQEIEEAPATPTEAADIPEWMKAAGWGPSSGEFKDVPVVYDEPEPLEVNEGEPLPGEMPDWLRSMAPPDEEAAPAAPGSETSDEQWLEGLLPAQGKPVQPVPQQTAAPQADEALPDWLAASAAAPVEPLPSWLSESESAQPAAAPATPAPKAPAAPADDADAAFAWLEALAAKQGADDGTLLTAVADRQEKPPEWVQQETAAAEKAPPPAPVESVKPPTAPATPAPKAPATPVDDADAAFAWLEALAAKQGADDGTLLTAVADRQEKPPEWVQQETAAAEVPATEAALPDWLQAEEAPAAPVESAEAPAWLSEAGAVEPPVAASAPPAASTAAPAEDMDAAFAWLESLAAKHGADDGTLLTAVEDRQEKPPEWVQQETAAAEVPSTEAALPDWMQEEAPAAPAESAGAPAWLSEVEAVEPPVAASQPPVAASQPPVAASQPPAAAAIPADDADAAFAWLESLAAKHGADDGTLLTAVEDRQEKPPEWVQQETAAAEVPSTEAALPDWMQAEEAPAAPVESAEAPAWLSETAAAEAPVAPAATTPADDADAAFAWLEALAAKQGADDGTLLTAVEDRQEKPPEWVQHEAEAAEAVPAATALPDWMQVEEPGVETPQPAAEMPAAQISADSGAGEDADAAFAWLESLAAKHGADDGTLLTAAEERQEKPPEWVQQAAEAGEAPETIAATAEIAVAAPETVEAVAPPTGEAVIAAVEATQPQEEPIPDWLKTGPLGEPAAVADTEPLPDWLQSGEEAEAVTTKPVEETVPTWLQSVEQPPAQEVIPAHLEETARIVVQPEASLPVTAEAPVPTPAETKPPEEPITIMPKPPVTPPAQPAHQAAPAAPGEPRKLQDQNLTAVLTQGQTALSEGKPGIALDHYNELIQAGEYLEETVHDLRDALYRYPMDIAIWQALGDAYIRSNRLQDALDAYTKAEELLR